MPFSQISPNISNISVNKESLAWIQIMCHAVAPIKIHVLFNGQCLCKAIGGCSPVHRAFPSGQEDLAPLLLPGGIQKIQLNTHNRKQ